MAVKRRYYWDACIFFAWLNDETSIHGPAVMDGISEMASDFDLDKIVLFTSVITNTEVFDHKLNTQWARDEYSRFTARHNFSFASHDVRVSEESRRIRDHYGKKGITLGASDCVHLATAILYKADVFFTLDGSGESPKPNDLLPLNGDVAGYPLRILKPHSQLGSLFSGIPKLAVSSAIKPPKKRKNVH